MNNHYNLKRKSSHDASFSTKQKLNPADNQDLQVPSQPATDTLNLQGVTTTPPTVQEGVFPMGGLASQNSPPNSNQGYVLGLTPVYYPEVCIVCDLKLSPASPSNLSS